MTDPGGPPPVDKIVGDLLDAVSAAAEIVARGRVAWDGDRLLRLAGEAVINRIGDAASKLQDDTKAAMPAVPWDDIRANRVLVAHIYHRIDYAILWATLVEDVRHVGREIERWRGMALSNKRELERDEGFDIGL